jgi:putative heme-binding domain-containing protein
MGRRGLWFTLLFTVISVNTVGRSEQVAEWIWHDGERMPNVEVTFYGRFDVATIPTSAFLHFGAESAWLEVYLDGRRVARSTPYGPIVQVDLTDRLGAGTHQLEVRTRSADGPAAFWVLLALSRPAGQQFFGTNQKWHCQKVVAGKSAETADDSVISLGRVDSRLLITADKRVGISSVDDYEQWKQALGADLSTDVKTFSLVSNFALQLIRVAQKGEDSWVSMAFDPQGRIIIAKEQQGLLRMTLSEDGGKVTSVETIDDQLKECRGLLFANGDLFVNANNSKALYRVPLQQNGELGERQLLYSSDGGVGHGRNDLALGPDGKLYVIHGDSVTLPTEAIDFTSPFRAARQGKRTSEGHLLRIDPETGVVEVLAAGLRNPFGIDFNPHGDIFTYDADAEYDMGAPWYRPTRVNHLVTGGDFGWRGVTHTWPPYYPDHPDNALPNIDIGKGSPTAVKFGTRSHFPPRYRDALFVLDWSYGRILAVHTIARGASYLMTAETFLKGKPLNVTDLGFGPNGAMYFVTGGRKTQSALYRVRYSGPPVPAQARLTAQQKARIQFARRSRKLRRELEMTLGGEDLIDSKFSEVWNHLRSDDPWIRHAARNVVEHQSIEKWQHRVLSEPANHVPVEAFLAMARAAKPRFVARLLKRMDLVDWPSLSLDQKYTLVYAYQLCLGEVDDVESNPLGQSLSRLAKYYPVGDYRIDRILSEMIASKTDLAITPTLKLMTETIDQNQRMHFLYVLRNARGPWTVAERRTYFEELQRVGDYHGGAGMTDFNANIRQDILETLNDSERKLYDEVATRKTAQPIEIAPRPLVKRWTLAELLDSIASKKGAGDQRRGAELFAAASCIQCHRFGQRGASSGPDLTSVANRFSRRDLLRSIVQPSDVVAEKYRSLRIVTTGGRTHVGQPISGGDFRSSILRLAIDPLDRQKIVEINKNDIEVQRDSPLSWMPTGLLDTLTEQEVADLLAYLESGDDG